MNEPKDKTGNSDSSNCSSSVYEYGHLTEELLSLMPDEPMTIADSFGDIRCAVRLRQMIGAYGDVAALAYEEACVVKYSTRPKPESDEFESDYYEDMQR